MTQPSPFLREALRATEAGRIDHQAVIESHRADLDAELPLDGADALALAAAYGRLKRCLPDRLCEGGRDLLARAERVCDADLLSRAVEAIPLGRRWIERLRELDDATLEDLPGLEHPDNRRDLARRLFADLDAAELAVALAAEAGVSTHDVDSTLVQCRDALAECPDAFVSMSDEIQRQALVLRPELAEDPSPLGRSTHKFLWLLDHLERVEAELYGDCLEPIPWGEFLGLAGSLAPPTIRRDDLTPGIPWRPPTVRWSASPDFVRPDAARASAVSPGPSRLPARAWPIARWRHPTDVSLTAKLPLGWARGLAAEASVTLVVELTRDGRQTPAVALAGQSIRLGDALSTLNALGMAVFTADQLPPPDAVPTLVIGDDNWLWDPVLDVGRGPQTR